ncbi:hypothetical protein HAX54_039637 [Datura stramonium]|uniref:Uncharacterized protein n=1 Tax=Datura stramonium TaxID=4076 RepID=A0ABS8VND8_DATST|nr:hypothetical protein [Datura stramonium]
MSQPISVDILSDDEDDDGNGGNGYSVNRNDTIDLSTPLTIPSRKKQRTEMSTNWNPTVLVIEDDDPTPFRPSKSTPSFVAETPMSDFSKPEVSFVKCSLGSSSILDSNSSRLDLTSSMG